MTREIDHAHGLSRLTGLAREKLPPPRASDEAASREAFLRVRRALDAGGARRGALWWWSLPLGAAAAVVLVLVLAGESVLPTEGGLAVEVENARLEEGGYVRAPTDADASLRFADGTHVKLARTSRGRIAATSRRGARVLLDHGRAQVKVVPRRGNRWVFDAGPCRVQVTGTQFEMKWSAVEQVLEVMLFSGSVTVQGPPAPNGVSLQAGQRLLMDVRQGSVRMEALAPAAPSVEPLPRSGAAAPAPPPAEAPLPVEPVPDRGPHGRAGSGPRKAEPWSARVLAGEFQSVLDEARRRGLEDVLKRESAANVMALADAARYADALPLARRALGQLRTRFPDSPQAHKAAFLLGRIAEDSDGDLARALEWYGVYLADAPEGAYRAEALGRRMTATLKLHGPERARALAEEYLRRHPNGPYASPARAILAP